MKVTKKQRIVAYAKQHPEGFSPKQLMNDTNIRDKNVWVLLAQLKKAKVLAHDPKTHTYKLLNEFNKPAKPKLDPARKSDRDTIGYLVDQTVDLARARDDALEKYGDALAVIRYLEDKLIKTIQYTAQFEEDI